MADLVVSWKYGSDDDDVRYYDVSELVEGSSVIVKVTANKEMDAWEAYESQDKPVFDKNGNPVAEAYFTDDAGDEITERQWGIQGSRRGHRHKRSVLEAWDERTAWAATEAVREFLQFGPINPATGLHFPLNQSEDLRVDVGTRVPNWVPPRVPAESEVEPEVAAASE